MVLRFLAVAQADERLVRRWWETSSYVINLVGQVTQFEFLEDVVDISERFVVALLGSWQG